MRIDAKSISLHYTASYILSDCIFIAEKRTFFLAIRDLQTLALVE